MNFYRYYPVDVVNGPGTRCTLFVSGCEHKCRGCYNTVTWPLTSGTPFTEEMTVQILRDLNDNRIRRQGLSLTGGDPLHPENVPEVLTLTKNVRQKCPDKDIWLWTGYTLEALTPHQRQVVDLINVLIDGKFVRELQDPRLAWRGSSNQKIYYLR